jgi:hypothetical protein
MSKEALKLALEALEAETDPNWKCNSYHPKIWEAITAIKQALAASVQEPVASYKGPKELWLQLHGDCSDDELTEPVDYTDSSVTWCWHQIHDSDVRYVRADTIPPAAPVQEPPPECQTEDEKRAYAFGWWKALEAQRALDKKAENARELGLDYEPDYKVTVVDDQHPKGVPLEQWGRVAEQGEDHMRQLIEDLISAMEYHVEQTRPIHSTTVALQAAREAIRAKLAPVESVAVKHMRGWVEALKRQSDYGQHMRIPGLNAGACFELAIELEQFINSIPAQPAQRTWVGLTDDEIDNLSREMVKGKKSVNWLSYSIEAKLKERNNG